MQKISWHFPSSIPFDHVPNPQSHPRPSQAPRLQIRTIDFSSQKPSKTVHPHHVPHLPWRALACSTPNKGPPKIIQVRTFQIFLRFSKLDLPKIFQNPHPQVYPRILFFGPNTSSPSSPSSPIFWSSSHPSMDWFKGKSTGNHGFSHQIWCFPVNFPLNQSIERWFEATEMVIQPAETGIAAAEMWIWSANIYEIDWIETSSN